MVLKTNKISNNIEATVSMKVTNNQKDHLPNNDFKMVKAITIKNTLQKAPKKTLLPILHFIQDSQKFSSSAVSGFTGFLIVSKV
jgi:hypothetical protein